MAEIEQEILKACKLKGQRKKEDEQRYLMRILSAVDKLDNEDFFQLSEEAQNWADQAVDAVTNATELPTFASIGGGDTDDEDEDEEEETEEEEDSEDEDEEDESEDEDEDEEDSEDEDEEESEEEEDEEDVDEEEEEDEDDEDNEEEEEMQTATETKASRSSNKKKTSKVKASKKKDTKPKKDKNKKAAASKKDNKKTTKSGAGRKSDRADKKIVILEKNPPFRAGSKRAQKFEAAKKAKTVGDYLAAGGDAGNLNMLIEKKYVKLS